MSDTLSGSCISKNVLLFSLHNKATQLFVKMPSPKSFALKPCMMSPTVPYYLAEMLGGFWEEEVINSVQGLYSPAYK